MCRQARDGAGLAAAFCGLTTWRLNTDAWRLFGTVRVRSFLCFCYLVVSLSCSVLDIWLTCLIYDCVYRV